MKTLLIIFSISSIICHGQNLVQNGSFEIYTSCPTNINQVDSVLFWSNPTNQSPDYFNSCNTGIQVGVPNNIAGFQQAHWGNAYCGLTLIYGPGFNFREYIQGTLSAPLVQGQEYLFQMYVSISDNHRFSSDDFGVYFSNTLISGVTTPLYSYTPQIVNSTGFYPDTANWGLVSSTYLANGGEQYFIIGNFKNDANTSIIQVSNSNYTYAYLLIDDVSLRPITSTGEMNLLGSNSISPNPFNNILKIDVINSAPSDIFLFDIMGQVCLRQTFVKSVKLNTEVLGNGIYLYVITSKNGTIMRGKAIKN